MNSMHLILHGLAIKKHAAADQIARLVGLSRETTSALLAEAARRGRVSEEKGRYVLEALAGVALENDYSRRYFDLRSSRPFVEAYEAFEKINVELKTLVTQWQTVEAAGQRMPNDHSNRDYDMRIIDRLGDLHERVDVLLAQFERSLPRFAYYRAQLLAALEKAEAGETAWVSSPKLDSYHTLWFELHEDLLRMLGRKRSES
jgi:hypothetical protein